MRASRQVTAAIVIFFLASLTAAADRRRAVGLQPSHSVIAVGQEYRVAATPDSPWLESVAVAVGPSSGIVLWTEDGPKAGEASIRFARIAADGRPIDTTGKPLLETGHYQRHVAIDAFRDLFVAASCDTTAGKQQIVAILLDANGHTMTPAPAIVADNIATVQPIVGVTCADAGCLVSWGGNGSDGQVSIGTVNAQLLSATTSANNSVLLLAPKGIGSGIGTDNANFATAYAEPATYGQSGAFVARFISPAGATSEVDLLQSSNNQIGSTWMAWDGRQWLVLMLDLTTSGQLAQEFRFMRIDSSGHPLGAPAPALLDSAGVPLLCPWVPDVFLYDLQNRRAVWDGRNFLAFTQHAIVRVGTDGRIVDRVATDDYFPRSYALSVFSAKNGRTIVAYSRDTAVAIRAIEDLP